MDPMDHFDAAPDTPVENDASLAEAAAPQPEGAASADTSADDAELQKVELDLDDAPFLLDDEEELELEDEPPPVVALEEVAETPEPGPSLLRNKWVLAGAGALLLLLLAGGSYVFFMPSYEPELTEGMTHETIEEEPVAELPPPEPPKVEHTITMDPFWVETTDTKGKVRFLHFKFAFVSLKPDLEEEVRQKSPVLRDAVYYYLNNKDYGFLADTKNIETLKGDIVSVLNQYLGNDQLKDIYVEKYLVR
jgi:flagellar FliL protein